MSMVLEIVTDFAPLILVPTTVITHLLLYLLANWLRGISSVKQRVVLVLDEESNTWGLNSQRCLHLTPEVFRQKWIFAIAGVINFTAACFILL